MLSSGHLISGLDVATGTFALMVFGSGAALVGLVLLGRFAFRRAGQSGMNAGQGFYDWTERKAAAVVALRDKQIVRQLQFLREQGVFENEK